MRKKKDKILNPCPVRNTLQTIGGKWSFAIIYTLIEGKKRFSDLERSINGINTRMLIKELKTLEHAGIITRKAFPSVPPMVEYSLTEKGLELQPVFVEIQKWAAKHTIK